jgi:hypothetical protein
VKVSPGDRLEFFGVSEIGIPILKERTGLASHSCEAW